MNLIETKLPIMESFYTLQGEGFHAGKAAYFIRLGGCDVGCVWCDVKDSWDASAHPKKTVEEIVSFVLENTPPPFTSGKRGLVVITGGEPLMHNLDALTTALQAAGFATNIETSGAHPLSGHWDWICLSPKKFKAPIVTEVSPAGEFFSAEDYHQDYLKKNPNGYMCHFWRE